MERVRVRACFTGQRIGCLVIRDRYMLGDIISLAFLMAKTD